MSLNPPRRHKRKRKVDMRIVYGVCAVLLIILGVGLFTCFGKNPMQENEAEEFNPSIAIPGYEALMLKADSRRQTLALSNPESNTCYFRITLLLEDGTVLWESDLIVPGETSMPMRLTQKLEAGTYPNSVLRYDCFRMDKDLSPLNGAQTKLTLWVQ